MRGTLHTGWLVESSVFAALTAKFGPAYRSLGIRTANPHFEACGSAAGNAVATRKVWYFSAAQHVRPGADRWASNRGTSLHSVLRGGIERIRSRRDVAASAAQDSTPFVDHEPVDGCTRRTRCRECCSSSTESTGSQCSSSETNSLSNELMSC